MPRVLLKVHHPSLSPVGVDEVVANNVIGNNVGNFAFSYAAERALSAPENEVTAVATGSLFATPEVVNREYDHVVMPLANHFRASNIKALERQAKAMEQFTIPVTVLGVGGQASLDGEVPADEREAVEQATRRFVRAVLERGPSIGVRGEFTKSYLVDLGFDADRVDVIGCPSLYLHGGTVPLHLPDAIDPQGPLAINVSPYVTAMGPILVENLRRYPGMTYFGQDIRTLKLLVEGKALPGDDPQLPLRPDHPAFAAGRTVFPLSMPVWMSELGRRQLSLGTRIHGNIVSLLAGTPAIVLAHDSRTLELARYHQIPHRQISELAPADLAVRDLV
ncbi:MAG: polysaccharide pyruvyl transferase family protein, partial [Actinomycetales bacterium]